MQKEKTKLNLPIKIKKLSPNAKLPEHGSAAAAGYDVFACIDETIELLPHTTSKVSTGLAVEIPEGYFMGVFARSGLATKEGLRPSNCVGVIDSDYRGIVIVAVHNDTEETRYISPNQKIAQLIVLPFIYWDIEEVQELNDTDRGSGGFGSTGK